MILAVLVAASALLAVSCHDSKDAVQAKILKSGTRRRTLLRPQALGKFPSCGRRISIHGLAPRQQ